MLWAGITVATAAVSSFFADALGRARPGAGADRSLAHPPLVVVLAALAALNIAGVRGANRFNAVMTVAKLVPLVLLVVVRLVRDALRRTSRWTRRRPSRDVARASVVLIFAFLGVESALVPSGEVRDPARTVPRAIFIAMIVVTVLYLAVQIVAQGVLGAALAGQPTPLAEAAAVAMGRRGAR